MNCASCGADLASSLLSCPRCHALIYADKLTDLTRRAKEAWRLGHFKEERSLWAEALSLLPEDTVQHRTIGARVSEIDASMAGGPQQSSEHSGWKKASIGIGPALVLLFTKGKLLLLGLTKIGTLLSMAASLGVYWSLYGWPLALGLILSIYIHEMGHVDMIRRYGFPASAPMFIPGLGAFIQLRGIRVPPIPDSRIGLAGPTWGLAAAVAALIASYLTGIKVMAAIAHFGAWVNLFNLIPVWQLDGSRGLHSFSRVQRVQLLIVAIVLAVLTRHGMFVLIAACTGYRLFTRDYQAQPDNKGFLIYVGVLAAYAVIMMLTVTGSSHLP